MDRPCRLQGERRAGAAAMKISNTASAVRVTLSPTEISDLQFVIEAAERAGHYMPARVPNIMAALTRSADDVRMKQAMKRAEKDRVTRIEQDRRARERQFMLGDRYSVMASRADYADASSDPDARRWVDLVFHEIMQRPPPDQYELARAVRSEAHTAELQSLMPFSYAVFWLQK